MDLDLGGRRAGEWQLPTLADIRHRVTRLAGTALLRQTEISCAVPVECYPLRSYSSNLTVAPLDR